MKLKTKNLIENIVHGIFLVLGLVTVASVLMITVYLIVSGIPAIKEIGLGDFLLGKKWASTAAEPSYGILPFILTSVYGTAGAIVLGVPVGFMAAVYLAKMADKRVRAVVVEAVSLLAGIPSVVYGLVGMMVLVPGIRKVFNVPDGASLLAAMIVLAIMILPSIIKVSMTSLEAVPKEYEDASLALGATPTETYFRVSVPAAKSGIAAAVVLGVGRAIGEAMAVMMVSGNAPILNTLYIVLGTLVWVLPLGVGAAIYLTEYASNHRIVGAIEYAAETLSGIPSIIYGLVGMLFFCNFLGFQTSLQAGAMTLVIMNLPTVMRTTQESLKTVPQSLREGAFGLGAGKWRVIRTVVFPGCVDGIITGCILAVGRILGESAALLFTAGFAHNIYNIFVDGLSGAGATLTVALYVYAKEQGDFEIAFAIAAILMALTVIINLVATLVGKYYQKRRSI